MTDASLTATAHSGSVGFMPDICRPGAVFMLVLVGELLALVLVLVDDGLVAFSWSALAMASLFVQWVMLLSAALICRLRVVLGAVSARRQGVIYLLLVLLCTLLVGLASQWVMGPPAVNFNWLSLLDQLLVAAVVAGIGLRYFYLQQQLQQQQQAELRARLQALQARIQPHFLFNSLNAVASMIASNPKDAETTIEELSDLFRASLTQAKLIPLAQELDLCRSYLNIEQRRLGQRLRVNWQVPQAVPAVAVPPLLLQPLLENAVVHGVQTRVEGGELAVSVRCEGKRCEIDIVNPLPAQYGVVSKGLGLASDNVARRLQAVFADNAEIRVLQQDQRYRVSVSLPLEASSAG